MYGELHLSHETAFRHGFPQPDLAASDKRERTEFAPPSGSLYVISNPILSHRYRGFRRIPTIDAIILTRAEMVLLAPLDRPAAQALAIDLYILHCAADFRGIGGPTPALVVRFEHQAAGPPLGRLVVAEPYVSLFFFSHDLRFDAE